MVEIVLCKLNLKRGSNQLLSSNKALKEESYVSFNLRPDLKHRVCLKEGFKEEFKEIPLERLIDRLKEGLKWD